MIENSVIGLRCRIGRDVTIRNSIMMGADFYETPPKPPADGRRPAAAWASATAPSIDGAIVDKNCRIGRNVRIVNDQRRRDQRGNARRHDPRRHRLRAKGRHPPRRLADGLTMQHRRCDPLIAWGKAQRRPR